MNLAICTLSIIPVRADRSHKSEMVTQLLYNEVFYVLNDEGDWSFIQIKENGYEGWIQNGQYKYLQSDDCFFDYIVDLDQATVKADVGNIKLLHGSPVNEHSVDSMIRTPKLDDFVDEFPKLINHYLHAPYLWGGRSVYGIDCSGLSQLIYKHLGVFLFRDAWQQAEQGQTVDFVSEAKQGDLAFFDNAEGRITHVGIMMDEHTIFHASSKVRIDKFDSEGIFNVELNQYTHKFRIMKRYF